MIPPFNFSRIPNIVFGPGKLSELYEIIPKFGKNMLFVIGESSLKNSGKWAEIRSELERKSFHYSLISISGEPSPLFIDDSVQQFQKKNIELVVGIGGGSVTDAGKAISAMIPKKDSIKNYLEGVGSKNHDGNKLPFIAIPTTSGTGSEVTKNAVISDVKPDGFKKSLRHDNLIPNFAIIDPELMITCPPSITAACGMDAFTQLIEAFLSPKGNPMTDTLALNGMKFISENLLNVCSTGASDVRARTAMAYGSLISGIALANAGLGIVHGLASSIGGYFKIPHGVACGTLLSEASKMNIKTLKEIGVSGEKSLRKYAQVGALMIGKSDVKTEEIGEYCSNLTLFLDDWIRKLRLDRLSKYGITKDDVDNIIDNSGLKNNPISLNRDDLRTILMNRL
ncbi:MAG: iron-containing alcohol dehydrogenase [Promethearchaeota archaeon]|jgi:alcohol dehydrogenase